MRVAEREFDHGTLVALHEVVERFYVTDRRLRRAQARMARALDGSDPSVADVRAYLAAVERYFAGFEREARRHLRDIERRLARVAQLQFNLTAERGVATQRVAATQGVLARLRELGAR